MLGLLLMCLFATRAGLYQGRHIFIRRFDVHVLLGLAIRERAPRWKCVQSGVGFAWSFVLILITPLLVSAGNPTIWLGARTYSLVLNQALRGMRALWIYEPGMSFVTKKENAPSTDQRIRVVWGVVNVAVVCFLLLL